MNETKRMSRIQEKGGTIQAIIFDMDGVIVDSEPLQAEADRWVCETNGIFVEDIDLSHFKGKPNRDTFAYLINTFTDGSLSVSDLVDQKRKRYMEISRERLTLVPGSEEFLAYARKKISKIALATSSNRMIQKCTFDKFDLHRFFDTVTTGDEVTNGKPHPEPYLLTLKKLQISPERVYVIEDSGNGVLSAKAAGCRVIGITTSFSREFLLEKGADMVVDSFEEIRMFISSKLPSANTMVT